MKTNKDLIFAILLSGFLVSGTLSFILFGSIGLVISNWIWIFLVGIITFLKIKHKAFGSWLEKSRRNKK